MATRKPPPLPEWERVLSSAAQLQRILPEAVLVGGTASAVHAGHRYSRDADHVLTDLRSRFDEVLAQLESVAGWKTARIQRPVQILGKLDGIETGVRQLIRDTPLETEVMEMAGQQITLPTAAEILRIKAVLILKRNATRDYLDFVALATHLGEVQAARALYQFDLLYPQSNGESALQQLHVQLAQPLPYDLEETNLQEYKNLVVQWQDWSAVQTVCHRLSSLLFDRVNELQISPDSKSHEPFMTKF
jgi:Nucleotidyl transferase AbiEii toxin, Type IV TA system